MTIKQMFSVILSVAFMTATGLVFGTPVTSEEFKARLKTDLAIIEKALNLAESKKHSKDLVKSIQTVSPFEKECTQLYSEESKKSLERAAQSLAQLKFHTLMQQVHTNDYR